MSQNYAEWLYKFDRGTHAPTTQPEPKWTEEQTWRAIIEDFKNSPITKLKEEPTVNKESVMAKIRKQAEEQKDPTESLAEAISRVLAENPDLYTEYMDAPHSDPSEPNSEPSEREDEEEIDAAQQAALNGLDRLARERQQAKGISYEAAYTEILNEHPTLYEIARG